MELVLVANVLSEVAGLDCSKS